MDLQPLAIRTLVARPGAGLICETGAASGIGEVAAVWRGAGGGEITRANLVSSPMLSGLLERVGI